MILSTFEQAFKTYLKTALATYITDKNIVVSNDVNFKPFEDDTNTVIAVIQSGNGNRSMMSDVTDALLTITLICESNYTQDLLLHINQYINATSGVVNSISISESSGSSKTYLYQVKWKTPMLAATPQDIRVEQSNKIMKVALISLQGTINFTSEIELAPSVFKLRINGNTVVDLPAKVIANYNNVTAPQYKAFLLFNYDYPVQVKIAHSKVYDITLLRTEALRLALLDTDIDYMELSTDDGATYISMATYQITDNYANAIPTINVLLNRGNTGTIDTTGITNNNDDNTTGIVLL